MLRHSWSFRILTGLCFAVPAAAFAWVLARDQGAEYWRWIPLSAGIGAFLTSVAVWRLFAERFESLPRDAGAGAIVGLLAHPVAAVASVLMMLLVQISDQVPGQVEILMFVLFWWCLLGVCGVGWLTMGIGAITGCILGLSRNIVCWWFNRNDAARSVATESTAGIAGARESEVRPLVREIDAGCTPATVSALLALIVTCLLTLTMVAVFWKPAPPPFQGPFEKSAVEFEFE